ncbi:hypothetical protein C8J56DRAFT_1030722 [Mycena floridula]|nr:hypothetical protein C8J56DRAFT_1030708 [Mycena floridula]KAJ7578838.1 hypothetical protein C8J56DRAFT_1030722 [Mycena floridula]
MASFGVHWLELVTMDTTATSVMRHEQYNFGTRMTGWSAEKTWIPNNVVRYHRIESHRQDDLVKGVGRARSKALVGYSGSRLQSRERYVREEKGLMVGAGIPPHAILSNLSWSPSLAVALSVELLRGITGLAEKMTRWDQELVLQLRNETASLAVKIMPRPIHGFTRSTDKTTLRDLFAASSLSASQSSDPVRSRATMVDWDCARTTKTTVVDYGRW